MQAKVTLACACEEGGVLEQMQKLPHALNGAAQQRPSRRRESYRALDRSHLCAVALCGTFLDAGGNR